MLGAVWGIKVHHRTVEQLASGNSVIHRLDARVKLLMTLVFVLLCAVIPGWPLVRFVPLLLLVLLGIAMARLPWLFVLRRVLVVFPFVGVLAVFLPFTKGTTLLWHWDWAGISIYQQGLEMAAGILTKGAIAILAVSWLVFTTPFGRLLLAMRWFGAPRIVVAVLGFLFRYLDLMADESMRVRRARRARSPRRINRWASRSTGGMVGRLLLRTLDRAERVHAAMVSRGYDGEVRVLVPLRFARLDLAFGVPALLVLVGAGIFGFS